MKYLLSLLFVCFTTIPSSAQQRLPAEIQGNWLQPQNNFWKYGFYDHFAMADGTFWDYKKIEQKGKSTNLILKQREVEKKIRIKTLPDGNLKIKNTDGEIAIYTKKRNKNPDFAYYDTSGFEFPLIRPDSVYLSGIISGYDRQKDDYKFVKVIYDPLLEENQRIYISQIDSLGRFRIVFPLINPQEIMLEYGHASINFYGLPGKALMICTEPKDITPAADDGNLLFSNKTGLLNTEWYLFSNQLHQRSFFSLNDTKTHSLDEEPYQQFRLGKMQEQLNKLSEYVVEHNSSTKFVQQTKIDIQYGAADDLLRYRWLHNGDPNKPVILSDTYLSFLQRLPLNNKYGVLTSDYFDFLQEYIDLKKAEMMTSRFSISLSDMLAEIKGNDHQIDSKSLALLKQYAKLGESKDTIALAKFAEKNESSLQVTFNKYADVFNKYADKIISKQREKDFHQVQNFIADSINNGPGKDILLARIAIGEIEKPKVLSQEQLAFYNAHIHNDALAKEINLSNHVLKQQLSNKKPANMHIISPLKKAQDSVFESLIAPYKGKVVYIDFWAPWCGPCISEMPDSKTLQKQMKGKEVVFLYLCVQSPKKSWESTLKSLQLPGEHYLLSDDEYALLSNRFQIGGIPRYILVDENGKVADDEASRPSSGMSVIKEIEDLLKGN